MEKDMGKGTKKGDVTDNVMKIKQEPKDGGDIKDFAETTMNELLGWYGYEKVVDHQDTENLDLQRFTTSTPESRASSPQPGSLDRAQRADVDRAQRADVDSPDNHSVHSPAKSTSSTGGQSDLAASHRNLVSALTTAGTEAGSTDQEGSVVTGERETIVCQWCQKEGVKLFTLKTEDGTKGFCSELCFTLCRRASFKKNKLCDWCKHIRHTVSFVDFQDGDQQLQFCSDKCLNQYKMNIFCKETQVHLQQIQSQVDTRKLTASGPSQRILITPDLWEDGGPNEEKAQEGSGDQPLDLDTKSKDNSQSPEVHVAKAVHSSRHSTAQDRPKPKREDITQRTRTAEITSTSNTTKSAQMFEKPYTSERERLRRIKSRDSTSSTPLSMAASSESSLLSPPRSSASCESNPHFQSNFNSRAVAAATATGPLVGSGLSSLSHGGHPLLYHPMLAASLGNSLPGLGPPGSVPPFVLPTAQPPIQPPSSSAAKEGGCSDNLRPGSMSQPTAEQGHPPPQQPMLVPPPHLLNSLWSSMAGGMPAYNPYSPYPGSCLPAMPNPLSGMMPPNTLMVPYPIIIPLPVPIPIPIPIPIPTKSSVPHITIKPEPLSTASSTKVTSPQAPNTTPLKVEQKPPCSVLRSEPKSAPTERRSKCESSRDCDTKHNEQTCENKPAGKIACACCQQTSVPPENLRSVSRSSSECGSIQASHSDSASLYKTESHPSRIVNGNPINNPILVTPEADLQNDVIDLSKDSIKHPPTLSSPLSDVDHNRNSMPPSASPLSNDHEGVVSFNPLALVPLAADPRNSARRSLILDAPSVAREKNRSPSPGEKRAYYGNSQREGIYGKRRCIRSRVKTK